MMRTLFLLFALGAVLCKNTIIQTKVISGANLYSATGKCNIVDDTTNCQKAVMETVVAQTVTSNSFGPQCVVNIEADAMTSPPELTFETGSIQNVRTSNLIAKDGTTINLTSTNAEIEKGDFQEINANSVEANNFESDSAETNTLQVDGRATIASAEVALGVIETAEVDTLQSAQSTLTTTTAATLVVSTDLTSEAASALGQASGESLTITGQAVIDALTGVSAAFTGQLEVEEFSHTGSVSSISTASVQTMTASGTAVFANLQTTGSFTGITGDFSSSLTAASATIVGNVQSASLEVTGTGQFTNVMSTNFEITTFTGAQAVFEDVNVSQQFTSTGTASFNSGATITGQLEVAGQTTLNGNFDMNGAVNFNDVTLSGELSGQTGSTLSADNGNVDDLVSQGQMTFDEATFTASVTVTTLQADSAQLDSLTTADFQGTNAGITSATFRGNVVVTGDSSLQDVDIEGDTTAEDVTGINASFTTLTVQTISAQNLVAQSLSVDGAFTSAGSATFNGASTFNGMLTATSTSIFNGLVSFNQAASFAGTFEGNSLTFASTQIVSGSMKVDSAEIAEANYATLVSTNVTATNITAKNLVVAGQTQAVGFAFDDNVLTATGDVAVQGDVAATNGQFDTITVSARSSFLGAVTMAAATVTGSGTIAGAVTGASVDATQGSFGSLAVDGAATFGSLTTTMAFTVGTNMDVTGTLAAGTATLGTATMESATVNGNGVINGALTVNGNITADNVNSDAVSSTSAMVTGNVDVDGTTTSDSVTATGASTLNTVTVNGNTNLMHTTVNGSLSITSPANTAPLSVTVDGATDPAIEVSAEGRVMISGPVEFQGGTTVECLKVGLDDTNRYIDACDSQVKMKGKIVLGSAAPTSSSFEQSLLSIVDASGDSVLQVTDTEVDFTVATFTVDTTSVDTAAASNFFRVAHTSGGTDVAAISMSKSATGVVDTQISSRNVFVGGAVEIYSADSGTTDQSAYMTICQNGECDRETNPEEIVFDVARGNPRIAFGFPLHMSSIVNYIDRVDMSTDTRLSCPDDARLSINIDSTSSTMYHYFENIRIDGADGCPTAATCDGSDESLARSFEIVLSSNNYINNHGGAAAQNSLHLGKVVTLFGYESYFRTGSLCGTTPIRTDAAYRGWLTTVWFGTEGHVLSSEFADSVDRTAFAGQETLRQASLALESNPSVPANIWQATDGGSGWDDYNFACDQGGTGPRSFNRDMFALTLVVYQNDPIGNAASNMQYAPINWSTMDLSPQGTTSCST